VAEWVQGGAPAHGRRSRCFAHGSDQKAAYMPASPAESRALRRRLRAIPRAYRRLIRPRPAKKWGSRPCCRHHLYEPEKPACFPSNGPHADRRMSMDGFSSIPHQLARSRPTTVAAHEDLLGRVAVSSAPHKESIGGWESVLPPRAARPGLCRTGRRIRSSRRGPPGAPPLL
jgi:hypothetical protein